MHSQNEKQKENSNDRLFEYSCVMVSKKKKKGGGHHICKTSRPMSACAIHAG